MAGNEEDHPVTKGHLQGGVHHRKRMVFISNDIIRNISYFTDETKWLDIRTNNSEENRKCNTAIR